MESGWKEEESKKKIEGCRVEMCGKGATRLGEKETSCRVRGKRKRFLSCKREKEILRKDRVLKFSRIYKIRKYSREIFRFSSDVSTEE